MESLLSLLHMDWDHKPTPNPSQEGNRKYSDERLLPSWEGSGVGWFIESLDDSEIMHRGHGPLAVPRWTESADKSDALQTLRARCRVSGGRVSVWSACVFSAAFPRQAPIRWPGRFTGNVRARIRWLLAIGLSAIIQLAGGYCAEDPQATGLHVGAAAVELEAADTMIIAGGITAGKATGQEGKLRATAVVLEKQPFGKLAIIACDVLMITRQHLDPVVAEIEKTTGIPSANILINCTHTHHAPSTMILHGYGLDDAFTRRVQRGIVKTVQDANANLSKDDCRFFFHLGEEKTVGQNSRMLLEDGQIYWVGPRDKFVRPTGPFDPELAALLFRDSAEKCRALIFNHSTHTIGTRRPGVRSPSFYGLAAQELEDELGGIVCFLEGASGSTHNLTLAADEMTTRIKQAVKDAVAKAQSRPVSRLVAIKRPFKFKVRTFDEAKEDEAVTRYCRKYVGAYGETVIRVFRAMRKTLAPQQGQERETWLQVLLIGDVAIVGVPAEFFTKFGLDIKNRSSFRYTYVAELSNDWIGYLPDFDAHKLGGYQVWTGLHSYAEPGTGERMVDATVKMLNELANAKSR